MRTIRDLTIDEMDAGALCPLCGGDDDTCERLAGLGAECAGDILSADAWWMGPGRATDGFAAVVSVNVGAVGAGRLGGATDD